MVKQVTYSDFIDHVAKRNTGTSGRVKAAIKASPFRKQFELALNAFCVQANSFEIVDIHWWYYPYVYVDIIHTKWKHYPCNHRALVSFDLTNGKWASFDSDNRYVFARRGWGRFMDDLCCYRVPRYSDCGNKEKTTYC